MSIDGMGGSTPYVVAYVAAMRVVILGAKGRLGGASAHVGARLRSPGAGASGAGRREPAGLEGPLILSPQIFLRAMNITHRACGASVAGPVDGRGVAKVAAQFLCGGAGLGASRVLISTAGGEVLTLQRRHIASADGSKMLSFLF